MATIALVGAASCADGDGVAVDAGVDAFDPPTAAWVATLADAEAWLAAHDVPGMTLSIVVDGAPRFAGGLGVRRWGGSAPVTTDTRFQWLSISKLHTATAAMRLVEAGALDLDAPVVSLVPELHLADGGDPSGITTRHLLTHTSGLTGHIFDLPDICERSLADVWASYAPTLRSPPGAIFLYNPFQAYSIVGLVVERAAGTSFELAMEELVFGPAGMSTATYDSGETAIGDHAVGTSRVGETVTTYDLSPEWTSCPVELGPGGLIATATDVAKLMAIHLADGAPLLTSASAAAMRDQVDTHATPDGESRYGLGMYRRIHHGTELLEVWAWGGGFRGKLIMAPSLGWGITVAANADWADPGVVAIAAIDRFFPELPDEEPDFATDPSTWDRYTGVYHDPHVYGDVTVELRGDTLFARPSFPATEWRLEQVAGDLFEVVLPDGARLGVQFVATGDCPSTAWFATFGQSDSPSWPSVPSGVAHRDVEGC